MYEHTFKCYLYVLIVIYFFCMLSGLVLEPARTWALWESEPHVAPVSVGGAPADLCTEHPFWPGSWLHSPACVWEDASSRSLHCRMDQWLWRRAEMVKWYFRWKIHFEINFLLYKIIFLLFCEYLFQMSSFVVMLPISDGLKLFKDFCILFFCRLPICVNLNF